MTKFKDAMDETNVGPLWLQLNYDQTSSQRSMRPVEPQHINTIRLALRIAQAVTEEPSEGMLNAALEVPEQGYGVPDMKAEFRAMIEQMMGEIENEN